MGAVKFLRVAENPVDITLEKVSLAQILVHLLVLVRLQRLERMNGLSDVLKANRLRNNFQVASIPRLVPKRPKKLLLLVFTNQNFKNLVEKIGAGSLPTTCAAVDQLTVVKSLGNRGVFKHAIASAVHPHGAAVAANHPRSEIFLFG